MCYDIEIWRRIFSDCMLLWSDVLYKNLQLTKTSGRASRVPGCKGISIKTITTEPINHLMPNIHETYKRLPCRMLGFIDYCQYVHFYTEISSLIEQWRKIASSLSDFVVVDRDWSIAAAINSSHCCLLFGLWNAFLKNVQKRAAVTIIYT